MNDRDWQMVLTGFAIAGWITTAALILGWL